jgi:hypothetical protein
MQFLGFVRQFVIHEVPHREESHDFIILHDGQVPAAVRLHALHGFFESRGFVDGRDVFGHDLLDGGFVGLQAFDYDTREEVALAEHAFQFTIVHDQNRSDVQFSHAPGDLANSLGLFHAKQLTLVQYVAYSRHRGPSWKRFQPRYHIRKKKRKWGQATLSLFSSQVIDFTVTAYSPKCDRQPRSPAFGRNLLIVRSDWEEIGD